MALILVGSYMVRYPLGGNLSWPFQWILGLRRLGHDVYLVERSIGWDCYDPEDNTMGHDPSHGLKAVSELFERFGMEGRICFQDHEGNYPIVGEEKTKELFRNADLFIDIGTHGLWQEFAAWSRRTVYVDGEPGYNQMRLALETEAGKEHPKYDSYYTNGVLIPQRHPQVPDCGVRWNIAINPIVMDFYPYEPPVGVDAAFTTVMNWQAHKRLEYHGEYFGQKDEEFAKFLQLPTLVKSPMEVAVAGKGVPRESLEKNGWRLRSAQQVTATLDNYGDYIHQSAGEFSVAKNVFVKTRSGWFSERSNCFLASGRPVVVQETGFSEYLPCGEGLFAVTTAEEAADAINQVRSNPERHARRAHEIAREYLSTDVILPRFLKENEL